MTDNPTLEEVRRMFGGTIPQAAMDIINDAGDDTAPEDLRRALAALAASAHAAPKKRRFRVLFGKELNGQRTDGKG